MIEVEKQTEEKIFDAATEVFIAKGMDGARMQDIADLAGINKALLHYYYRTKEHLFNAVFEKLSGAMFAKFSPLFDKELPIEDKIRFFFKEHISFMQKNQRLPAFVLNEMNRNPERMKKFLKNIDIKRVMETLFEMHREELKNYNITEENIPQFITTVISISIFPFAAKGILEGIFGKMKINFDEFLAERKDYAADFVINAIKKED